jgi:hypothetical protein
MFEAMRSAVEEVEIPGDGDALVAALALLDKLTAKVSLAAAQFQASRQWELDAATSAAVWLRNRAGMTSAAAAALVNTGAVVGQLTVTVDHWLSGGLSTGQVKAIAANVDDRTVAMFAEHERDLIPFLAPLNVPQTTNAMRHWRARAEATLDDGGDGKLPDRSLHLSKTLDGRFELSGSFDALSGEILDKALRMAMTVDRPGEPVRTLATRRADALVDLARANLDHDDKSDGRNRPHLNVVVDYDNLAAGRGGQTVDGSLIDGSTIQTLLCDANVHRVITKGGSTVLDYGTATRVVGNNLWNALVLRDRHCRFEGCERSYRYCEAHHVVPVMKGGPTRLDNLVLKCSRHHHIGHLPGWHETLRPDGTLVTTDPKGRTRETRPPGVVPTVDRAIPCLPGREINRNS